MIEWLTSSMPVWHAVGPLLVVAVLSYSLGKLHGFNLGVEHGRASQGAINKFAEELEASVTPGKLDVEPEDVEAAVRAWLEDLADKEA